MSSTQRMTAVAARGCSPIGVSSRRGVRASMLGTRVWIAATTDRSPAASYPFHVLTVVPAVTNVTCSGSLPEPPI